MWRRWLAGWALANGKKGLVGGDQHEVEVPVPVQVNVPASDSSSTSSARHGTETKRYKQFLLKEDWSKGMILNHVSGLKNVFQIFILKCRWQNRRSPHIVMFVRRRFYTYRSGMQSCWKMHLEGLVPYGSPTLCTTQSHKANIMLISIVFHLNIHKQVVLISGSVATLPRNLELFVLEF